MKDLIMVMQQTVNSMISTDLLYPLVSIVIQIKLILLCLLMP